MSKSFKNEQDINLSQYLEGALEFRLRVKSDSMENGRLHIQLQCGSNCEKFNHVMNTGKIGSSFRTFRVPLFLIESVGFDPESLEGVEIFATDQNSEGAVEIEIDSIGFASSYIEPDIQRIIANGNFQSCPGTGNITYDNYQFSGAPEAIRTQIERSMTDAIALFNCATNLNRHIHVRYEPTVPTANANCNTNTGVIRFGGLRGTRVALHELQHSFGVGCWGRSGLYDSTSNTFSGRRTTAIYRFFLQNDNAVVPAGRLHLWRYGLNFQRDGVSHCTCPN